jgi:tetratricopeptide (TPR) repeat protein
MVPPAAALAQTPEIAEVESALLDEKWEQVSQLLTEVDDRNDSPPLRLIKVHASVKLNANNDALRISLALSKEDLEICKKWAEQFAANHPNNAVSHYFMGDVLARLESWDAALESLNRALNCSPQHVLSLHARGVVRAARGELDATRSDFREAATLDEGLAESQVSRGIYLVQKRTSPEKALECFEKALQISPNYVLALNNRGSLKTVLRKWDEATADLNKARELASGGLLAFRPLVERNIAVLVYRRNKAIEDSLALASGLTPGTDIGETLNEMQSWTPGQRQRFTDGLNDATQFNDGIMRNPAIPDSFNGNLDLDVGVNALGPYIEGGPSVNATWELKDRTNQNMMHQHQLLDAIQEQFGVTPNEISNIEGWMINHTPTFQRHLTPGGVSSSEVGRNVEAGHWDVFTVYGFLYNVSFEKDNTERVVP